MSFRILISGIQCPTVQSELPSDYRGPTLRGSKINAINCESRKLFCQESNYGDIIVRLFSGNNIKKFEIRNDENTEGLWVCFMVENSIRKNIEGIGKVHLRQDHHLILSFNNADCNVIIANERQFQYLEIFYSRNLLQEFIPHFSKLERIINYKDRQLVGKRSFWTPLKIKEIYSQLIYLDFDETLQPMYFSLKLREIFFHLLQTSLHLPYNEIQFTPYETARIYDAKSILEKHIDKKPPTIKELSKMVAINEFKLKQGFRKYFNAGIFEWVTSEKMHQAKKLLEETNKPIKEIAALSGYPLTTNFITAFRKQFGITPGAIRRS